MGRNLFPIFIVLLFAVGCASPSPDVGEPTEDLPRPFCGQPFLTDVVCGDPWLPNLDKLHRGARWSVTSPDGREVQVGYSLRADASEPDTWLDSGIIQFDDMGLVKIFARLASRSGCPESRMSRTYQVVEAYAPAANSPGTTAVEKDDARIRGWATGIASLEFGDSVDTAYRTAEEALGPATGGLTDTVSLGEGGAITLTFKEPIGNGPGPDFAVFENAFNDRFLELAFVEVSSDGDAFIRFPSAYLGMSPIGPFTEHDPELMDGLAGKYRAGYGTPFDLSALAWSDATQTGALDLHHITHIRIVDIPGDGRMNDSSGSPIYDPFPVRQSAGFDLDGVGILHTSIDHPCPTP